jgi:hypothetical protein
MDCGVVFRLPVPEDRGEETAARRVAAALGGGAGTRLDRPRLVRGADQQRECGLVGGDRLQDVESGGAAGRGIAARTPTTAVAAM